MKKYSIALAATMVFFALFAGAMGFAQSSNPKELAQQHIEAAKKAAGYEVADLYDHLCSRLLVGAGLPFGRIIPQDNDRDPSKFHAEPVKVFDNLYYVGEKMQHGASPSAWAITTSDGIILIDIPHSGTHSGYCLPTYSAEGRRQVASGGALGWNWHAVQRQGVQQAG